MVLITGRELNFALGQEAEKIPDWNRVILEFYKAYW